MKYYIKKYQLPSLPLNKNYPSEITDLFMLGKYKEFEDAKKAYDEYYGKILPEVEITATKPKLNTSTGWTSEHNVSEDNKKYEQAHQAESLKIASAVSKKMNEVGNKIGLGMTAAVGAGYLAPATMAGWSTFSAAHPLIAAGVDGALTTHGISNLFGENGVLKTYNHFKNGEVGRGILSGTVDALDVIGGIGLFNKTRLGITTLKTLTNSKNIGKNFLIPASDFVAKYPNLANTIATVIKPKRKYLNAINDFNEDRGLLNNFGTIHNGIFFIPRKIKIPTVLLDAINEGRYVPLMSFNLKKNYILSLKDNYIDIIENHTLPFNKKHLLKEVKNRGIDDYLSTLIKEKPKLVLDNRYNGIFNGRYDPNKNTVRLITKNQIHNILKPLNGTEINSINWIIAHELDHWVLTKLPKLKNTVSLYPKGYYHINQNMDSDLMLTFPNLLFIPYERWKSSPHEWRSELAGFMKVSNAPKDVSKWDNSLRDEFNIFMNKRFGDTAKNVKLWTGLLLGDFTLDMFTRGYKQGGTIHIKEKNKGKFTESAKRAGKSVQEHARDVVNNPKATKLQKKRALFVLNAKKFKHG